MKWDTSLISETGLPELDRNDPDSFGGFEAVTSGTGIGRRARDYLQSTDRDSVIREMVDGELGRVEAVHVLQAARMGDEAALDILDKPVTYMGIGIANAISLLNPEMIVIGGGVAEAGDVYLERVRSKVGAFTPIPSVIVPAELGNDAGAIGAIAGALEQCGKGRSNSGLSQGASK